MPPSPKLPFPLPDQHVTTLNIDGDAAGARILYPFLPEYVGLRNPYNGEIIRSSDDYERYLREHCYYNRCYREFRSIRIRLEDALDENLRLSSTASRTEKGIEKNKELLSKNESLSRENKQLNDQQKKLLTSVSKQKREHRIFVSIIGVLASVIVLLSVLLICGASSRSFSSNSSISSGSSTSFTTSTCRYIGNSKTKIIHDITCSHLPYKEYRVEFQSLAMPILEGYSRCPSCLGGSGHSRTSASSTSPTSSTTSTKQTEPAEHRYIGNKSSKKVHTPDCSFLPDKNNRIYFDDLDEALDNGYEPCKKCHPR